MNTIRVVGIDIAKSFFQVCVWMDDIMAQVIEPTNDAGYLVARLAP